MCYDKRCVCGKTIAKDSGFYHEDMEVYLCDDCLSKLVAKHKATQEDIYDSSRYRPC